MSTYTIELTAEQLKALSAMTTMAELWKNASGRDGFDDVETEIFWKVQDQMDIYYDSKGITD